MDYTALGRKAAALVVISLFIGIAVAPSVTAYTQQDALDELSTIIQEDEDCGCNEESSTLDWKYPVLCTLLYPVFILALYLYFIWDITFLGEIIWAIGTTLNCFWTHLNR